MKSFGSHVSARNRHFVVPFTCAICEHAIIVEFVVDGRNAIENFKADKPMVPEYGFEPVRSYPRNIPAEELDHVPENIARFFMQAVRNSIRGDADAAGAMARKVLDTACKTIDPRKRGGLSERIIRLGKNSKLPPMLVEWATLLKNGGNAATHDEEPTTDAEAAELVDFARLFLLYVFTMPGRIAERRATFHPEASKDK